MDILTYINRMNQIYGNGQQVAPRYNTQQYLQGGRVGYKPGGIVEPGVMYYGKTTKTKRITNRQAKEIIKTLPDGVRLNKSPTGWRLTAEIYKGDIKQFSKSYINPDADTIKQLLKTYEIEYKKVYPNTLNNAKFKKLRLSKKYRDLTANQFADELNELGYNSIRGKEFDEKIVNTTQARLNLVGEVGKKITPLNKSQQKTLTNAFPEYAGQWDFKENKYGLNFSEVGGEVWNMLKATSDDKKRWPTGGTAKSRLWHNAYRSALKGGDEGRFKILHPKDGAIMSRDEILKYNWTKGSRDVTFLDTKILDKTKNKFNFNNFENWMNNDAVPGQVDANRFKNAEAQYDLNKKLKQTYVGDETLGSLLDKKFKKGSKQIRFSGLVNHHIYDIADNFWDTDIVFFDDNKGVAKFEKGVRAELKAAANLPEIEQAKVLKNLTKKFKNLGPIRMVEGQLTIGSYDQKKMLENVGEQLNLKKGTPLHTELMKYCPRGKQLAKAGGGRIGFSGNCSIDEAATGLKNELSKVKNPAQLGKFGKIGRLAGGFFGWVDAPIELTFALPGLLKGDKDEALRNTTLGLFGAGKTEMEKLTPGTALYNVAKNIKDVQDYTNNLFEAQELEAYTTKLEGMLKKYPNDPTIEDDLAQTNLQKQKIIDDTQTIIKDYREVTGDETIQARKELRAQEIASAQEGFDIGGVKFAPYGKPKDLSNVKDYIENKGDPYYRAIRVADENLGGIMGYDENAKDIRDRYTDLPLELASQYGKFEKQEADKLARQKKEKYLLKHSPMPFSEYVPSILRGAPKFIGFNKGGRVSFKGGGIDKGRRAFMKLLAALGIGTATAGAGLIKLGGKAVGKKAAVKTGVDIATGTQGMPSWFPALVNKIIKEGDDVTKQLGTVEREVVHTKKIDTGSASPDEVTVYQNLDTGDIRVEVDSVSNMGEAPIQLDYKAPSVIDEGKSAGKKTKSEFSAVETEPRVVNWDGDIEFDGENIVGNVDDLFSDTTKLKNYAKGEKPTMKDFVTNKKKTDKVKKINEDTMEQIDYIENKQGHMAPEHLLDEPVPDDFASGGRVNYDTYLPGIDDID